MIFLMFLLSSFLLSPLTANASDVKELDVKEFDEMIIKAMDAFQVPGASVAIIKDDQVFLSKGYGFRDVEKQLEVTKDTLFPIGSVTKSFTAATLATLADEDRISWDVPIREYLSGLYLYDNSHASQLTLTDALTHRSGLGRHDFAWYAFKPSQEELLSNLRYLEPSKALRTTFQYNNILYALAGKVTSVINKNTWENTVKERILDPLLMPSTNFSVTDSQKTNNFALPYWKDPMTQELVPIEFFNLDSINSAGSINSTADDMSHYLSFLINQGVFLGKQIISPKNMEKICAPEMLLEAKPLIKEFGPLHYGLGLISSTYRKRPIIYHNGHIDGFSALIMFLPEQRIGISVIANLHESRFISALALTALDRLLELSPIGWNGYFLAEEKNAAIQQDEKETHQGQQRKKNTKPSHEFGAYAGAYKNPGYGTLYISHEHEKLMLTIAKKTWPLEHVHYDIFAVSGPKNDSMSFMKLNFHSNFEGDITSVSLPLEPSVEPLKFVKRLEL